MAEVLLDEKQLNRLSKEDIVQFALKLQNNIVKKQDELRKKNAELQNDINKLK